MLVNVKDGGVEFDFNSSSISVPSTKDFVDFTGLMREMKKSGAKDKYLEDFRDVVTKFPELRKNVVLVTDLEHSFNVQASMESGQMEEEQNPELGKAIASFNQTCDDIAVFGHTCRNVSFNLLSCVLKSNKPSFTETAGAELSGTLPKR